MKTASVLLVCLLGTVMIGCVSAQFAPLIVEKIGSEYQVKNHSLVLNNHIRLTERSVARNDNNIMIAQLRGDNVSKRDIHYEYRFIWMDARGIAAKTRTSDWRQGSATPKQPMFLQATAPSPDIVDFLCEVRFRRDGSRW